MNNDWKIKIRQNLIDFYRELEMVCRQCGRKVLEVKVLYAVKYLNSEQFVTFLNICKEIDILPVIIGENRVQEAKEKMDYYNILICGSHLRPDIRQDYGGQACRSLSPFSLVMIGNLQRNKINKAIEIFEEIHSVDSLKLAEALDKRICYKTGPAAARTMPVFLEVNVSGEKSKHGFSPEKVERVIREMREMREMRGLDLRGLMTMAPLTNDMEKVRPVFTTLRKLADKYNLLTSMGMSNDWQVAVEEGADIIRIGSKIFC